MQAPSYTFLIGEYACFLECMLTEGRISDFAKKHYEDRLKQLKAVQLDDLPLRQAEKKCITADVLSLIKEGLYGK